MTNAVSRSNPEDLQPDSNISTQTRPLQKPQSSRHGLSDRTPISYAQFRKWVVSSESSSEISFGLTDPGGLPPWVGKDSGGDAGIRLLDWTARCPAEYLDNQQSNGLAAHPLTAAWAETTMQDVQTLPFQGPTDSSVASYGGELGEPTHGLPRRKSQCFLHAEAITNPGPSHLPSPGLCVSNQQLHNFQMESAQPSLMVDAGASLQLPEPYTCPSPASSQGRSMTGRSWTPAEKSTSSSGGSVGGVNKASRNRSKAGGRRRPFQCTFCYDLFKSKYEWSRHEKSLHLNVDGWVCAPHGGSVLSPLTGRNHCAYCNMLDPLPEHLETHRHGSCQARGVFTRKDHLLQHLRVVHRLYTMPIVDNWKIDCAPVISRCGFCSATMSTWDDRVNHLARHFRNGSTMAQWEGEHCFVPAVACHVRNAAPPTSPLAAQEKASHVALCHQPSSARSVVADFETWTMSWPNG